MVFEGIVVGKIPYKERDLIVKLLLRNGHLASFYVFGGQGGGKQHKPAIYDLGVMMKVMIKERRGKGAEVSELMHAAESQKIWEPLHIRHDYRAYYLSCLYLEMVQKFALTFHPDHEANSSEHEGVFSVLSNAIFYLDDAVKHKVFLAEQQLSLFIVKLLHHLGIMPETDHCSYCHSDLFESAGVTFLSDQGNFACHGCAAGDDEKGLLYRIKKSYQTRYQDYSLLDGASFQEADKMLQYFCHHFHLRPMELKSYSVLFK